MAKQQSRKPTKDADKIGASEANQPTRKGEHQPRGRKPRTRSGRAAAETLADFNATYKKQLSGQIFDQWRCNWYNDDS